MRLSRFTDIGLRALMVMSARPERIPAGTLAEIHGVSRAHLTKSLQRLASLGLVDTQPGPGGGFRLSRDPADVRLGDLVRDMEPSMALAECFAPGSTCVLTGSCRLAGALDGAKTAFLDELNRYTLADLVAPHRSKLVRLVANHG
jgi:Rrf2 family nitric oxide-sensitive transcriptional repressor